MNTLSPTDTTATLISWLSDLPDASISKAIIAQRRILSSKRTSQHNRALATELLTALHREAGQRVAKLYQLRSLNS
jgi:hypothetical protein